MLLLMWMTLVYESINGDSCTHGLVLKRTETGTNRIFSHALIGKRLWGTKYCILVPYVLWRLLNDTFRHTKKSHEKSQNIHHKVVSVASNINERSAVTTDMTTIKRIKFLTTLESSAFCFFVASLLGKVRNPPRIETWSRRKSSFPD